MERHGWHAARPRSATTRAVWARPEPGQRTPARSGPATGIHAAPGVPSATGIRATAGVRTTAGLWVSAGGGGTASEEESVETVGVGEPGEVGGWIVTVNGTETAGVVGDGYSQEQAQGEFVIVDVTVENSGTEATYFDETALSLIDADGNEHSAGYVPGDEDFFVEQINPGNRSSGRAAFDVPEGTEPVALQVEDMLSFEDPLEIRLG
ncbi:MAG TPA: DUF4352 domain-containing protein [Nocardiopsis listeri]|nr:DUF4352 domain-containing protein [Nocardiopsis listeri]HJE58797.1 DUF4352 domain-containing protein [Nocardiopsis listeri]